MVLVGIALLQSFFFTLSILTILNFCKLSVPGIQFLGSEHNLWNNLLYIFLSISR
jgi:hypothetical protein